MKISIIKNDTDMVVASYQINLDAFDHQLSDEEFILRHGCMQLRTIL